MRAQVLLTFAITIAIGACGQKSAPLLVSEPAPNAVTAAVDIVYPTAKTVEQTDTYHGTVVFDPYRWMEDLDSPQLATWVEAENQLVRDYLANVPGRDKIKSRLQEIWNYERFGIPKKYGENYFYTRNDGLQNQSPIYVQKGITGAARLLIDPNSLGSDGTIALAEWSVSSDGKYFAYSLSDGGSDWRTIKLRKVDTGVDTSDEIRWAKFTEISWAKDGSGIYYSGFDEPKGENELKAVNKFQKVYFHRLGERQDQDTLVYERQDQPDWGFTAAVSDDGNLLIISGSQGTDERNRVFYQDLRKAGAPVQTLVADLVAAYLFLGNVNDTLFFLSDDEAELNRVIAIDLKNPGKANWKSIVPAADALLSNVSLVNHQFVALYLRDALSEVKVFDLNGKIVRDLPMPALGAASGFEGAIDDAETFFSFASYTLPENIYRYDAASGQTSVFRAPTVKFQSADYETTRVFYNSKDGTRIPLLISSKKGVVKDGNNPTILYGYGGFNVPVTPRFSPSTIAWMEMGGVYAAANLRGGSEYGRRWHEGGMKLNKQNVFDDFAAAAEYLIAAKYTQPKRLAISGRSNGGLLVAATMLQRPELFGAALPAVGVLDMLRFRDFTIGWAWESDYGSVLNADEFQALLAYSPLHNIKSGVDYPPTLITTADRDDRVYPAHSFKFAAALQAVYPKGNPILIRIETRAGHGAGKPTDKQIEESADIYAFLRKALKM
ncbi:MAG: prolyl oligopeptidase family serine peptidase [Pseudomonadota bacterium]|nr:prolyl oligopeptidase family serine peptidase [Pseudomonadota bacterium]